jgi:CRP-like cAMP-binding protein
MISISPSIDLLDKFYYKNINIVNELANEESKILYSHAELRHVKKGQIIFQEGDEPTGIYILKEGRLKKYTNGSQGKEHIFCICCKGDIIGHHDVLLDQVYQNSLSAIEDTVVLFIQKETFLSLLNTSPRCALFFLKNIGHEYSVMVNRMTAMAQKSVRERLALYLLILDDRFKDNPIDGESHILLSRNDLANMVGTAKETLIRLLHDFRDEELIRTEEKSIVVMNKTGLIKVADLAVKRNR